MNYLFAFLIGGLVCALAQIILELFNLTPGKLTCLLVILGTFLEFGNLYDKFVKIGFSGASLPITSFGHGISHSAYEGALKEGFIGLISSPLTLSMTGISLVIIMSVLIGVFFKPKG